MSRRFLASTREGLLKSAGRIGPHVQAVIQHLLQRKVTDGLKPSRAILRLAKQVGQVRLDAACERALYYDNIEYGTVKTHPECAAGEYAACHR
jgi:hypothetical protein